jgi:hypothetical protein
MSDFERQLAADILKAEIELSKETQAAEKQMLEAMSAQDRISDAAANKQRLEAALAALRGEAQPAPPAAAPTAPPSAIILPGDDLPPPPDMSDRAVDWTAPVPGVVEAQGGVAQLDSDGYAAPAKGTANRTPVDANGQPLRKRFQTQEGIQQLNALTMAQRCKSCGKLNTMSQWEEHTKNGSVYVRGCTSCGSYKPIG